MAVAAVRRTDLDTRISFMFPQALVTRLQEVAMVNDRTMSAEIRRAIEAHLAREEQSPGHDTEALLNPRPGRVAHAGS